MPMPEALVTRESTSTAATAVTEPTAEEPTVAELMAERTKLRRQVSALKAGSAWLEKAAELCADMDMRGPGIVDAIHHARRHFLSERYHGLPLCDVERTIHRQGMNALVVCIVYEVTIPAITRQLDAMEREMRDDPTAVEQFAKSPPLIFGTLACWPRRGAGRP